MAFVPQNKLILWVGITFLPVSILMALLPEKAGIVAVLPIGLVAGGVLDAIISRKRLSCIHVTLPEVVRLSLGRDADIRIEISQNESVVASLRFGLQLPAEIYSNRTDMQIKLPMGAASSFFTWPLKGLRQGSYQLQSCYLETTSRFGFWAFRRKTDVATEIRVYPNLMRERKNLAALFLNRGVGMHSQRQVGKGRDFEQLREYLPGDSYEDIHWKSTAKRGQPVTKVYQIERTQQIYIILDGSRLSVRNTDLQMVNNQPNFDPEINCRTTVLDRYVTAALVTGLAAERQGDLFGVVTFDNQVRTFLKAKGGKAHYHACRDALYRLGPKRVSPDYSELFAFLGTHLRSRALLIFLTNIGDPVLAESFKRNVHLLSRRHLVMVNMLKPEIIGPLFATESAANVDDVYTHLGGHLVWRQLQDTRKALSQKGVEFNLVDNEKLCAEIVSQYLTVKRRQIL